MILNDVERNLLKPLWEGCPWENSFQSPYPTRNVLPSRRLSEKILVPYRGFLRYVFVSWLSPLISI